MEREARHRYFQNDAINRSSLFREESSQADLLCDWNMQDPIRCSCAVVTQPQDTAVPARGGGPSTVASSHKRGRICPQLSGKRPARIKRDENRINGKKGEGESN
jgi:hypothetical protein